MLGGGDRMEWRNGWGLRDESRVWVCVRVGIVEALAFSLER